MKAIVAGLAAIFGAALYISTPGAASAAPRCSVEAVTAMAGAGATITSVQEMTSPIPYCRIEGDIITTNPGPNKVGFMVALPEQGWNGRFFFNSVGGSVGFIQEAPAELLTEGFAVATTDAGHRSSSILDWSDLNNQGAALDMAGRSIHVSAVTGEAIARAFYQSPTLYRYLQGCSGGGTRTLNEARFYTDDFDGFVAEAPGVHTGEILSFVWATQYLFHHPESWISPDKLKMVEAQVNLHCGAIDGVVADTSSCHFDPAVLKCTMGDRPDCLTDAQVGLMEHLLQGPSNARGQLNPGLPISNVTGWISFTMGAKPPPWTEGDPGVPAGVIISNSFMRSAFGDKFNYLTDFDFGDQSQIDGYNAADRKAHMSQQDADLSAMVAAGKKLIIWQGMSDPGISYVGNTHYYDAVRRTVGPERADAATRMYGAPGVLHCAGGTGPTDMGAKTLAKMIEWVEHGVAPGPFVATRPSETGIRQFLICPYPEVAVFNDATGGKSDPIAGRMFAKPAYNASNWSCQPPGTAVHADAGGRLSPLPGALARLDAH